MNFLSVLTSLGPTVVLPIIITLVGLIFRQGFGKAIRSGITIGIGFAGINMVFGFFWGTIAPVAESLVKNAGFKLNVIDMGWPATSSVAWGSSLAPAIALGIIMVNFIMLMFRWTKTLNVDIWNYWGSMLLGQIAFHRTGSAFIGILTGVVVMIPTLVLADKTQKIMYDYFQIPGVSIPHLFTQSAGLIAFPVNWLLDRIPGINKINLDPENIQKKMGIVGEPMILGLVIGAVLALIARLPYQQVLTTGMGLAASMVLLPRMVSILMEGMVPVSEAASEFMTKKFEGREIYIGMDSAIMLGDPVNLTTAVLLIPIAILLAVVLPGNKVLPLVDLPSIVYMTVVAVGLTKGNLFRSVLIGIPMLCATLWTATAMAPYVTVLAREVGFDIPAGTTAISSLSTGYYWFPYLIQEVITKISSIF
ncbi:MAG TPA: PTS galactitol transporter subunit IIC [Thermoanaerobacterales bacterium]|nr:PTS galactitol transporter subunit IIC [Thermoanaerobacterales bacterium]